jgi:dolichyl-phosphate beta-glucosyltransferase
MYNQAVGAADVSLSIVVPAYNESGRIGECLEKLCDFIAGNSRAIEILIVDDHSKDDTAALVSRFIQANPALDFKLLTTPIGRKGKGAAVNRGMLEAKGKYRLFTDVDLSTPIEEVKKLLFWVEQGYDVVFGSRGLNESDVRVAQPIHRRLAGLAMRYITRTFVIRDVRDTQCGFKLFTEKAARDIFGRQRVFGWSFDLELLTLASLLGYKYKEVPVIWVDSRESKVNFVRDATKMFFEILSIGLRLRVLHRIPQPDERAI